MPINMVRQRQLFEAATREGRPDRYFEDVRQAFARKELRPSDFSLRGLFEHFVKDGYELLRTFDPRSGESVNLREAAINTGAFANITGQIFYNAILQAYESPQFIGDSLVTVQSTQLSGEKIPGISNLGDVAKSVDEGKDFPTAGVVEEWIETPDTQKYGFIDEVTKEAIFFDRTGLLIQRAGKVGEALGISREKRILSVVLGVTNNYKRNGQSYDTYDNNSGYHDFDNLIASNGLSDWTNIDACRNAFDKITDPNTGEPIVINPNTLIIPGDLMYSSQFIKSATEFRKATSSAANTTIGGNPLQMDFDIMSNAWVYDTTSSATTWFFGDPRSAFAYMENWPITVTQAPPNSEAEFQRDVVARFKASERGKCVVMDPRKMIKCTA